MKLLVCLAGCLLSAASYAQYSVHLLKNNNQPIPGISYTELKGKTLFMADDKMHGMELWETDGQVTTMVADIDPNGDGCGYVPFDQGIFSLNNKAYFAATDGQHGVELWEYDGTNPPKMVADIASGTGDSKPEYFVSVNNKLYFVARPAFLWNIYCYDPANGSTTNISNFTSNAFPEKLTVLNGKLVFEANMDAQVAHELYTLDLQKNNVSLISNINPGAGEPTRPGSLTVFNNKLYFLALENSTGDELYEYDGINAPVRLTDINPGSAHSAINGIYTNLCAYKSELYFGVATSPTTSELYKYDPATKIAMAVTQFNNKFVNGGMIVYGRKLYFGANQGGGFYELHVYDGTNPAQPISAYGVQNLEAFESLAVSNGRLFFGGVLAPAHEGHSFMFVDSMALDVPEMSVGNDLKAYPNPATAETRINFTLKQSTKLNLLLTDMDGRIVFTTGIKQYAAASQEVIVPLQNLAIGNYIYSVMSDKGETLANGRLTKQ